MGNLIDIRAVAPPKRSKTGRVPGNRVGPDVVGDQANPGNVTRVLVLHSHYRKARRDLSCVRVIAASAIVAGLLLGTAPLALAQVGQLIASVPAAFSQVAPAPVDLRAATVDSPSDSALPVSIVQHRLGTQPAASMISWDGTGEALRCSYSLLFEGSNRPCEAA